MPTWVWPISIDILGNISKLIIMTSLLLLGPFRIDLCLGGWPFFVLHEIPLYVLLKYITDDNYGKTESPLALTMPWKPIELFLITRHRMPISKSSIGDLVNIFDGKMKLQRTTLNTVTFVLAF